jgi:hypothetical protein
VKKAFKFEKILEGFEAEISKMIFFKMKISLKTVFLFIFSFLEKNRQEQKTRKNSFSKF